MTSGRPERIAIDQDDYHAEYIGRTSDGQQFFLTTPFVSAKGSEEGTEFVALFLFDEAGNLSDAKIENFGPRARLDWDARYKTCEKLLSDLGDVSFERIEVKPFSIERFGTVFGLIVREPENANEVWAVVLHPGNYMAFFEPWDSGSYDT